MREYKDNGNPDNDRAVIMMVLGCVGARLDKNIPVITRELMKVRI